MMDINVSPPEGSKLKFFLPVIGMFLIAAGAISLRENSNDFSFGIKIQNNDNAPKIDIIAEMEKNLVEAAESDKPQATREGKPLHITGEIRPPGKLIDPDFKISGMSLRLERSVQMYQWIQETKTKRISTSYTNPRRGRTVEEIVEEKGWAPGMVKSSRGNPIPQFANKEFSHSRYLLGGYSISYDLLAIQINWGEKKYDIPFTEKDLLQLSPDLQKRCSISIDDGVSRLYMNAVDKPVDSEYPYLGDLQIRFLASPPQVYSVIGMQKGNAIVPYVSAGGKRFFKIVSGIKSFAEMTDTQSDSDEMHLGQWFYFGTAQILLGFFLVMSIPLIKLIKK